VIWTLLLIWLALMAFFLVGSVWFQGYIYTEPAAGLVWRGPVAGTILALFFALWCYLAAKYPGSYDTVFNFSPREEIRFSKFKSERRGQDTMTFELRASPRGRDEYLTRSGQRWSRSDAVIIEEEGQEVRFAADRDEEGNYKITRRNPPWGLGWLVGQGPEQPLRYRDEQGRIMTEDAIGRISISRWGIFFANMFFNLFHFVLWFVCLWVVVRFQWAHALGLAFLLWLIMTIPVLPILFEKAQAGGTQPREAPRVLALARGVG